MDLSGQAGNPLRQFYSKIVPRQLLASWHLAPSPGHDGLQAQVRSFIPLQPHRHYNWDVLLNPDNATPIDGDPVRIVYARSCLVHYLT